MPTKFSFPTPAASGSPAVSVIIPMYNAEKYIAECLDSLLNQTFQDFEVIAVDDCSEDNSVAIVNDYVPKFGGRLSVVRMEKNSGYAGFPRNKGIELADGEYLYFIDPDDTIAPTALEELYSLAKKFDADIVHCEKYYAVPDEFYHDAEYRKNLKPYSWPMGEKIFVTEPTLLTDDLGKRVKNFSQKWLQWASWMQLIRRDFLRDNGIRFLNVYSQDMVFTMCELCCAKNYLVVPNVFYYWRKHKNSKTQEDLNTRQILHRYVSTLKQGINYLDEFLNRQEFFAKQADLKYVLFDMLFTTILERLDNTYHKVSAHELCELLRKEFDGNSAFAAFTFNAMNAYRLQVNASPKSTAPEIETAPADAEGQAFYSRQMPAVSVVVPMYNAEEFIGECLDSLLIQTFQDFEVIVVDDCSTDNGVAIVKNYMSRFNGRLKLTHTKQNSGGGGYIPRNIGQALSRGKYIFFADSDDFLLPTGLQTLYEAAEKFNADITYIAAYYRLDRPNEPYVFKDSVGKDLAAKNLEDKLTFMADDTDKIVQEYLYKKGIHAPWSVFLNRDFLMQNKISFPEEIYNGGDGIWNLYIRCLSKRFLRNPTPVYFRRCYDSESITRKMRPLAEQIAHKIKAFSLWLKALWKVATETDFLKENPVYAYDLFKVEIGWVLNDMREYLKQLSDREIYEFVFREVAKENNSPNWMMPFFFSFINVERKDDYHFNLINKFKRYLTARVDLQLSTKNIGGDFQIVSVSDKQAETEKPPFLQKDGIGYKVQSYSGKMEIVAKATSDGLLRLNLRGLDVRAKGNKSKRVPFWIDYTKLSVNGKVIFDKPTPAWHNEPYEYALDVKAGEEIKIQTEWLPHMGEVKVIEPPPPPPQKVVEPIADKFLPYLTARVDLQLTPKTWNGDFQIVSVSDDKADVIRASWLAENEIGYAIQSHKGKMEIVAKATANGPLNLKLRGFWALDPADNSKLFPYWIDYTKLIVNGEIIFDKVTPAWHDEPFDYDMEVKAGDEITVSVEWLPHMGEVKVVAPPEKIEPPSEKLTPPEKVEPPPEKSEPIDPERIPYLTGRVDLQLTPKTAGGDFKIVSVSDDKADIVRASWLAENEIGYAIQSHNGKMDIVAKATADGPLNLKLRGFWALDPADNSKLFPYWIDYTKLTVNGEVIFDKVTPAWHDEPFDYNMDVNAGDEIAVSVEWLPHESDT